MGMPLKDQTCCVQPLMHDGVSEASLHEVVEDLLEIGGMPSPAVALAVQGVD